MIRSVAAVGDVADVRCWSGIPFHFWHAAQAMGLEAQPWRIDLDRLTGKRLFWNALQFVRGRVGGFQYSGQFLDLIERQIPDELWHSEITSFNQHFPRASTVSDHGGKLSHYLDAPFVALASGRGLDLQLPRHIVRQACELERENYRSSQSIITMARWAAKVIEQECGVPHANVHVILPGANLIVPDGYEFHSPMKRPGVERDFVLGFVGKDWRRKGLPMAIDVMLDLVARGWKVRVLAAGEAPPEIQTATGVEFVGFIDKHRRPDRFLDFLSRCDVGCLFSKRESLGISTLEFLRAGVPVAGFAHEGPADTLPPDAGFRFTIDDKVTHIADRLDHYLRDEAEQALFRRNALRWSELVTWKRCVNEFEELWSTGSIANPVQPWNGLITQ